MKSVWQGILICTLFVSRVYALGGPPDFLTSTTVRSSNAIVIGQVIQQVSDKTVRQVTLSYNRHGWAATFVGDWDTYTIHVDHWIKGNHAGNVLSLEIFTPTQYPRFVPLEFDRVTIGTRYVFFLTDQQPSGVYRLTEVTGALIQLSARSQVQQTGQEIIIAELTTTLEDENPKTAIPVLQALIPLEIPYDRIAPILRRLTYAPDPQIVDLTLATRLQYGDIEALSDLVQLARQNPERDLGWTSSSVSRWQDINGLPQMIELANTPHLKMKRAAVYVLRQIGDTTVIPILAKLMLDDDIEVSYQAVMGLARITNVSYEGQESLAPAYAEFPKYRERIIQLWRQKLNTLEPESSK